MAKANPYEMQALKAELIVAGVKADMIEDALDIIQSRFPGDDARVRVQAYKKGRPSAFDQAVPLFAEGTDEQAAGQLADTIARLESSVASQSPAPRTLVSDLIFARGRLGPLMPAYFVNPDSQGVIRTGYLSQPVPRGMVQELLYLLSQPPLPALAVTASVGG